MNQVEPIEPIEVGGKGNTIPSRKRYQKVCLTLNNYTEDEMNQLSIGFNTTTVGYIVGSEIGESGTPHLQCYIEFKNRLYLSGLKKISERGHWEAARGTRLENIVYCSKDGNYVNTFPLNRKERILKNEYEGVVWKDWQQEIIDLIEGKPDNRKINWFWERSGNCGKSFLCKYLALKHDVIIADGKKDNIFNQIKAWLEVNPDSDPKIILVDVPRTNLEFINYGAIEQIKNGLIYSGKYEGGQCVFEYPHVIIFANEPPDRSKLSMDRWNIVNIK